ncbi:MAG: amino acid permease [Chitinophagaceae bacterium]|nr:MAG: amino acid permease [Chitinophagaceae bacterium]
MLQRSINKNALILLFINGVIGAGIFGLPSKAFNLSGVHSLWALLLCALAVIIIILCFAEVSSRFEKTGGPYLYALAAFGPLPAFITGWLLLLSRFITYAALINLLVTYLSVFSSWFLLPSIRVMSIISITFILMLVNYVGVKNSTRVNNFFTIAKLLPLFLFICVGFFFFIPQNFEIKTTLTFSSFSSTVLLWVFAFGGFESVLVNSGEVKNPGKNLPFALLIATAVIATVYFLIQLVSIGTLTSLGNSETPLADAAGLFFGKTGSIIISLGALFSITGTLNAIMLVGSRLPYAFSEENQFPKIFSFIHPKYKTPTWSLLFFAAITIIVSITNSFLYAATISAIIRLMVYGIVCIALIQLRYRDKKVTMFFKLPFGKLFAFLGIVITGWLLSSAKNSELRDVAIAVAAGLLVYFLVKLFRKK